MLLVKLDKKYTKKDFKLYLARLLKGPSERLVIKNGGRVQRAARRDLPAVWSEAWPL